MSLRTLAAGAITLAACTPALADTVEASSTTALVMRRASGGASTGLSDAATALELLSISARQVSNPVLEELRLELSAWGAYTLGDRPRWDAGAQTDATGDLAVAFAEGKVLSRRLTLRAGRSSVVAGAGQVLQLDGGSIGLVGPWGLDLSGYAGAPVAQRFSSRSGVRSWNPVGGDVMYGGRLGWNLAVPGLAGRGLDVGVFGTVVEDGGDPVKQEVGADGRLRPFTRGPALAGHVVYSVYDERIAQASASLTWAHRRLEVSADWRFVAPDLLLARNALMSVFSASEWTEVGGGCAFEVSRFLTAGADYHLLLQPGADGADAGELGHDATARLEYARARTTAGVEGGWLAAAENGYVRGRAFGRRELGQAFLAVDAALDVFREPVSGERRALTGTLTAGLDLGRNVSAALSARAGVNPYLEQTFDLMAKLTYRQDARATEGR